MNKLNKFLKNKNVVTIFGIIIILILLYFGYTVTINNTVRPIVVPVAVEKILPASKVTAEKVKFVNVSKMLITDNVYSKNESNNVIGKFTNVNVTIPAGSMFYKEWLVDEKDLPGYELKEIDFSKGEEAYYFNVDVASTLGNSVLPESYIDIYMQAYDENDNVMYGKLIKNIKVIAVHDGSGNDVFADGENVGSPAYLLFALSHDNYNLLMRAEYLTSEGVRLVVAPQGNSKEKEETLISSATLRDYVNKHTSSVTDDQVEEKLEEEKEKKKQENGLEKENQSDNSNGLFGNLMG